MANDLTLSSSSSPQAQMVVAWYEALTHWDLDKLASLMHDDYLSLTVPETANGEARNKEQGLAHARNFAGFFGGSPIQYEIFETVESGNKVWVHSKLFGKLPTATFNNESIFIFTLSDAEGGKQPLITVIKEFVDTKTLAEFVSGVSAKSGE